MGCDWPLTALVCTAVGMVAVGCTAIQAATQWAAFGQGARACVVLGLVSVLGLAPTAAVLGFPWGPWAVRARPVAVGLLATTSVVLAVGAACSGAGAPYAAAFSLCAAFDAAVAWGAGVWAARAARAARSSVRRGSPCRGGAPLSPLWDHTVPVTATATGLV